MLVRSEGSVAEKKKKNVLTTLSELKSTNVNDAT
jgi:hypothetical protein